MWKSVNVMYSMRMVTKQLSAKQSAVCLFPVEILSGVVMHVENHLSQSVLGRFEKICPVTMHV